MSKLVEQGFARRIPESELPAKPKKTWYIPHQAVITEKKPGKLRIVFDAGSRYGNTSLNSQLVQGANLANHLLGLLFRFRQKRYAISADSC